LPPLSTPIPNLNGMLATVLRRAGGGGGQARSMTSQTATCQPQYLSPDFLHLQVDGNFASTACQSTNSTY
jgi:hypothetical protein